MTESGAQGELKYRVEGMDCANCALVLERSLGQVDGVQQVEVSFSTSTLLASGDFDPQALVGRVEALGYRALPYVEETQMAVAVWEAEQRSYDGVSGFLRYLAANRQTAVALWGSILLILSAPLGLIPGLEWVQTVLQVGVVVLAGVPIANKGVRALVVGKQITIDLLMSIAVVGALLIGETGEAATVILLFAIGEALEGYTTERARRSLRSLLALKPDQATVLRVCMDCAEHLGQDGYTGGPCPFCGTHETSVPVEQVHVGELVVVRPGERIPVDGLIQKGNASINQAPVTGESTPISKGPGEEVFAGTLNGEAALEVTASRMASDSTISRIVRLVEQAQTQRAPIERFIDRFAAWYTPAVVLLAAGLAVLPPLLFGAPFFDQPDGTHGWLYRALALLIVACPCALVISTPVTVASALSSLARRGVLVKGGAFLEALAGTTTFAFDKTGTLTRGQPQVTQVHTADCRLPDDRCEACDELVAVATAVERRSEHPLARAILAEAEARDLLHVYPAAEDVQTLAGRGVQGVLNGKQVVVGSHSLFHELSIDGDHLHDFVQQAEGEGHTVMLVSRDHQILGFVSMADVLRESSRQALAELKAIDAHLHTVMLTGDNLAVAEKIAASAGNIDEVRAGLLPEDKLQAVMELQDRYGGVVMVGDGVNDAPALAAATVGVAMGGAGSAQAMETADVVLMQSDLTHLPGALRSSRMARSIIYQNITFSLAIKAVFLLLTLLGWATLWMAVFADMGASILVILNGMRMLKH
jgi:Cd2+/Zn2+-exporting ATPase